VGYRSVRVLLQRPTGQRITRNSRLDSAEFERAPADLASLHRFALLCAQLASPRLVSPLVSWFLIPLLFSPLSSLLSLLSSLFSLSLSLSLSLPPSPSPPLSLSLSALSRISFAVGTHWDTTFPVVSPSTSTRSFQPGYPADSRGRIENLLCADRQPIATAKRGGIDDGAAKAQKSVATWFSKFAVSRYSVS